MGRISIYWFIVFLTFLYISYKNRGSVLKLLIILCFYSGLAAFPGKSIENPYKIVLVVVSLYLIVRNNSLKFLNKKERLMLVSFIFFSVSFFISAYINGDYFNLTFSQFGKYFTPVCLLLILKRLLIVKSDSFISLKYLFYSLLKIQIILSVAKLVFIGLQESTVGSIAFIGGGQATMIPVLGFILIWLDKKGEISNKEWPFIIFLIFVAFASVKRAIWFLMPAIMVMFIYYIPKKIKVKHVVYFLPLIPLIFYAGVRLNPTLNKEGKIGGSFDFTYVLNYSQKYNFGKSDNTAGFEAGSGRGGATILLISKLFDDKPFTRQDYWGTSLQEVYTTDYDQFNEEKFGVNSKGAVTGFFQTYLSSGYIGIFATLIFILAICNIIKEPRIRITILLLMSWDYFFYSALILRTQALFVLLLYMILYSNKQFDEGFYAKFVLHEGRKKFSSNEPVLSS
jgi:hypothetical protein